MTEFEKQFREVQELLEFNYFNQTIKRVIDFALDTENIDFYTKTNEFLNWFLNDMNDVQVKVFEVEMTPGVTDVLMIGLTDQKAIQMNLFRLEGEDLIDLGYNYIEQKTSGKPFVIVIRDGEVHVEYDEGTEKPRYGLQEGVFMELAPQ